MDRITKIQRSQNMSKIRSKDTIIEVLVRRALFSKGIRYRKNFRGLPGSPDIAITSKKIGIFINGCFWHGHSGCKYYRVPQTNTEYWVIKINRNIERDKRNTEELENIGWKVIVVWECEVKNNFDELIERLLKEISEV